MFQRGEIVYHDNVIFGDNCYDQKEQRPCLVLFSVEFDNIEYVCTCPLTRNVNQFNKRPGRYFFIYEQVGQYRKLSFAKLDSVRFYPVSETHATDYIKLGDDILKRVTNAFITYAKKSHNESEKKICYYLSYSKLFDEIEQKEKIAQKKLLRKMKKQNRKDNFD